MVSDLNDLHRHRGAGAVRVHWDEQHTIEPAAANGLRDRARLETIRLLVCCCGAHGCGDVLRAVTQEMDDHKCADKQCNLHGRHPTTSARISAAIRGVDLKSGICEVLLQRNRHADADNGDACGSNHSDVCRSR